MPLVAYEYSNGHIYDALEEKDGIWVSQTRKNYRLPTEFISRHAGSFVLSGEGEATVPAPRFKTLRELSAHMFKIEQEENGLYAIRNVPVYKSHADTRKYGITCDEKFIDRMVRNFYATQSATAELFGSHRFSWRPKVHWGHTPDDPNAEERENAGFIDNLYRVQDFLVGDFVGLDKASLDKLVSGRYPDRSAEVDLKRARLLSVAALGFRTPHFALPQMTPGELRKQYLAVIEKNASEVPGVESHIFLQEDFGMPNTRAKKTNRQRAELTGDQVAKFFMDLQNNEEANSLFETLVDKHCDMMGGMMPQGGNLMAIIQQVMQQMMSQRMNSAPQGMAGQGQQPGGGGGYGQHAASDVLDMESAAHHGSGEEDLDEEGTDVAEGKASEDASVKKDGQPDVDSPDYDTVSGGGKVVKKSIASKIDRAKHTLASIKDAHAREQISAVLDDMGSSIIELSSFVNTQHESIENLMKEVKVQRNARRRENLKARFAKMFQQGNPNASSQELIDKHIKFVMNMADEACAEEYVANLESAPCLPKGRHVSKQELIPIEKSVSLADRAKHTLEKNRALRDVGVKPAHLIAVNAVEDLLTDEEDVDDGDGLL